MPRPSLPGHPVTCNIYLDLSMVRFLDDLARMRGSSRSYEVREAVKLYQRMIKEGRLSLSKVGVMKK